MGFSLSIPTVGQPHSTEDVKVGNDLTTISTWGNGNILGSDLSSSAAIGLGQLASTARRLKVRAVSTTATAVAGDLLIASNGSSYTITLPAPATDALVGVVVTGGGTGVITVATNGGLVGLTPAGVSSFPLGATAANIVLQSDGVNWFAVSGQQDSGWVALTLTGTGTAQLAGTRTVAYRLIGDRVFLRGSVSFTSTSSITIFTLPVGARPISNGAAMPPCANGIVSNSVTTAGAFLLSGAGMTNAYMDGLNFDLS